MPDRACWPDVYRWPRICIISSALTVPLGKQRDLGPNINGTVVSVRPKPAVSDERHVPSREPFVLVASGPAA